MAPAAAIAQQNTPVQLSIPIEGMSCAACVSHVEHALAAAPGVTGVSVNLATGRADVSAAPHTDLSVLPGLVAKAGYAVPLATTELAIDGMTCGSCVAYVEAALSAVAGVMAVSVNLGTERATVTHSDGLVPLARLTDAIARAGYTARPIEFGQPRDLDDARRGAELRQLRRDLWIAVALTLPVFLIEMGGHLIPGVQAWLDRAIGHTPLRIVMFLLTTAVLFGPGRRFYAKGLANLWRGTPDMNALVAVGTLAAYGYSVVATFAPRLLPAGTANVYYEAAAVIVTLVLLGRTLEAISRGRTSAAIRRLVSLQPATARVQRGSVFADIAANAVVAGDIIQLRPGERVPVDGVVVDGTSYIDEAMVTGEPVPAAKQSGSPVIGGTINTTGGLTLRATKVGTDTVLARIIRMVEGAQGAKLPIQSLVDRVTGVFVPVVMGASMLTFAAWLMFGPAPALTFALVNAVAVLIIACPCAMGLATPTSIMVATGRAAELGILFRRGDALQTLREVGVVALDKTGTLTKGGPELTDLVPAVGFDRGEVLRLVASLEARSEHPISRAIVRAAGAQGVALERAADFAAKPGFGIGGAVAGRRVEVGADRHMAALGIAVEPMRSAADALARDGKSPLYAAIDGRLAALIAVADPIKPSAKPTIDALHAMGLKVVMLTGDNRMSAEAVGRQLGIDTIYAELLPGSKLDTLRRLRADGVKIAFVGDGINDAPALAEADVGIAIGRGTDIAIESAEVVLMSGDLGHVANAIALSKATMRNIAQNLFWAFAYNAALIPIAAGVLYPSFGLLLSPMLAAGAMALSSVFVLTNALRLKSFAPPHGPRHSN